MPWGAGASVPTASINQAVAQITQTDMNGNQYVNLGHQLTNSMFERSFSADPGAAVTVSAKITGLIDWVNQNYVWNDPVLHTGPIDAALPYSGYQISATVSLLPMSLSGSEVTAAIPDPIHLDADKLSGIISFIADADPDIYYRLFAGIAIDTRLQNWNATVGPGSLLPDVGSIGTPGDPLPLTTTVSQASDDDGDGYTENQGDCNDSDNTIDPGAAEVCGDGIDQAVTGRMPHVQAIWMMTAMATPKTRGTATTPRPASIRGRQRFVAMASTRIVMGRMRYVPAIWMMTAMATPKTRVTATTPTTASIRGRQRSVATASTRIVMGRMCYVPTIWMMTAMATPKTRGTATTPIPASIRGRQRSAATASIRIVTETILLAGRTLKIRMTMAIATPKTRAIATTPTTASIRRATEVCGDGIDQDCDGSDPACAVDPEETDDDGDSYSENQGDCDDADAAVCPGATENVEMESIKS